MGFLHVAVSLTWLESLCASWNRRRGCYLFYDAKCTEEISSGLIEVLSRHLPGETEVYTKANLIQNSTYPASEVSTEHIPNTILQCYSCTNRSTCGQHNCIPFIWRLYTLHSFLCFTPFFVGYQRRRLYSGYMSSNDRMIHEL